MTIETKFIPYTDQNVVLEAFVAIPNQIKKAPLVLLCHAWKGRDEFIMEKAINIAQSGYIGFAIDLYGKGVLGTTTEENRLLKQPFLDDRDFLLKRILAGVEAACTLDLADTEQIVALGYGFGALCALDLARSQKVALKGAISVYGHFIPPARKYPSPLKTTFLILHGLDDPIVTKEELGAFEHEMKTVKADVQLHLFSNTVHAFATPSANDASHGLLYNPLSAQRSWQLILSFLSELFS